MPETNLPNNREYRAALPHQLPHPTKRAGRPVSPKEKHFQVAKDILDGKTMKQSLLDAGYSASSAHNAGKVISETPAIVAAMRAQLSHYEFAPAQRAQLARQRLVKTLLTGRDADANRACELIGKDKEVRMFEPDTQVNILNAYVPAGISEVIDAEVVTPELE